MASVRIDSDFDLGNSNVLRSSVATGTSPFVIASQTLVNNLNSDMLDGLHASDFLRTFTNTTTVTVSSAGWYRIAKCTNGNASAIFTLSENISGRHSATIFNAQSFYGNGSNITVFSSGQYSTRTVESVRITGGTTYAGAWVEAYLNVSGSYTVSLHAATNSPGWVVEAFTQGTLTPSLSETAVEKAIASCVVGNGISSSEDVFVKGSRAWHAGNSGTTSSDWSAKALTLAGAVTGATSITASGTITAGTFSGTLSGNASSATALATPRNINGTSFNGSADITTANWGTARTLTLGGTGKSINGSQNMSWTLAEIGALDASATDASGFSFVQSSVDVSGSNGNKLTTTAGMKSYVDAAVNTAGSVVFQSSYDASTDSPRLDTWTTSTGDVAANPIRKGMQWVVSVAGNFFTEAVEPGDLLISTADKPTTLTQWVRIQKNIGNVVDEKLTGYVASAATSPVSLSDATSIIDAFEALERNAALAQTKADAADTNANGRVPSGRTITITNGTGITGGGAAADLSANRSWTLGLTGQALALHNLATNGVICRTGSSTVAGRTITAGTGISITNGDGVSGNPTVALGTHSHASSDVTGLDTALAARSRFFRATGPASAATTWTVSHNLNVNSVIAQLWRVSDGKQMEAEFVHTNDNTLTIISDISMGADAYRVVVMG